jgi:hypothetical protein
LKHLSLKEISDLKKSVLDIPDEEVIKGIDLEVNAGQTLPL